MSETKKNITATEMIEVIERTHSQYGDKFCSKTKTIGLNGQDAFLFENKNFKAVKSPDYHYIFNRSNGRFDRWGAEEKDDPNMAPSCEIADIEITTICHGIPDKNGNKSVCKHCYKSNTPCGENMSFETFRNVFDKVSASGHLQQIAFGVGSEGTENPDIWKIMDYTKEHGVVPNITIANITDETADNLVARVGACAISRYENKDVCYNSVEKLTSRGLSQTNIHVLVSLESFDWVMETLKDRLTDPRLAKLNAIVLLSLKKRGRGKSFTPLPADKFKQIVDFAFKNNISVGFDSCSCFRFLKAIKDHPKFDELYQQCEPCESQCFSQYIDVNGMAWPCSFTPGYGGWENGLSVVDCENFVDDIWNNPKVLEFRKNLLATKDKNELKCRTCPLFSIEAE